MPNNESYVDEAQRVITALKDAKNPMVTTSKLRNLLSMTADIYNEVRLMRNEELDADMKERLSYLRVRCVYEAGRDESVKNFVDKSGILDKLKTIKTKKDYVNFSHYMESLVAWRKYLCEKDD